MRRGRFSRGRGGQGGGKEGRYRGGRHGGGRHRRSHDRMAPVHSGNERERIAVESGHLVLIDQFMLANPQFIEKLNTLIDADPTEKDRLIGDYGGRVVDLEPGTYKIERDPYAYSIIVHQEGERPEVSNLNKENTEQIGSVYVDTRCLAMVDRELLDDSGLLEKYQQLWFSGQDKACRDLLRDNGGAVRYGFQRYGDELGVFRVPGQEVICLWPDVANEAQGEAAE